MKWILLALICVPSLSFAEYRVYELSINDSVKGTQTKVLATMDHIQYPTYYPLGPNEDVTYVTSWMCYENTAHKELCKNPKAEAE